tara:strand:+ start:2408 stop:2716 length:309 start_codon:yes stop_codon:yes gene_type:complete
MEVDGSNILNNVDVCMECDDSIDNLCESMNDCNVDNSQITVYIATVLEKLVKEMVYEKKYDDDSGQYYLNITPPIWFNGLEERYQRILIKLIEPVLEHYMKQ